MAAHVASLELAISCFRDGRYADAEKFCRDMLRGRPSDASALHLLGVICAQSDRAAEAVNLYRLAIAQRPDEPGFHINCGTALRDLRRYDEAVAAYEEALRLRPRFPPVLSNLGLVYDALGQWDRAIASLEEALKCDANYAPAYFNLGLVRSHQGELEAAIACYRRALTLDPANSEALNNLGTALNDLNRHSEAAVTLERAIARDPYNGLAHFNLGLAHFNEGLPEVAIKHFRRSLEIMPRFSPAASATLLAMQYLPTISAGALVEAATSWNRSFGKSAEGPAIGVIGDNPYRRLRVGYVSPDFRLHSCGWFLEGVLTRHDRSVVEVNCFADVVRPDAKTLLFQSLADVWHDISKMDNDALSELVHRSRIDILVDCAGHTAGNRLTVFARRLAPIQVTWLGYPGTTGVAAMDYRLTDAIADPIDSDMHSTERLIRLPNGFLCYSPPNDAPPVAGGPALSNGPVTFGSFNNIIKLNENVIEIWGKILRAVPGSRLVLKAPQLVDAAIRRRYLAALESVGIAASRVSILERALDTAEHLASYELMDVALDPFPYNGTTTTCEALWMGVPVVSLAGDRHAGRVGASLLERVGLPELIAASVPDYVEKAIALAGNLELLALYRQQLRSRIAQSPLTDAAGFTRELEGVYRSLWRMWCRSSDG